ncbi:hypothetical protein [Erythrobacter sp.]|uniref:hypothetical protein n=1 Tax=Erythrobacter sp. TaxID=1042 RepID=UPI0025DE4A9E|nr:hypothetical protein [Erythrobacter sp.]
MDSDQFDEVVLALGHAVFAAQLFEMNLATLLVALNVAKGASSKFADEAAVRAWLDHVNTLPVGQRKKQISDIDLLPKAKVDAIAELHHLRIEIVHHFANKWAERLDSDEERRQAIEHLDASCMLFLAEAQTLQTGLARMSDANIA